LTSAQSGARNRPNGSSKDSPKTPTRIDISEDADLNRVIAWFITLRWVAAAGVLVTLFVVDFRLDYPLPFTQQ
jgi:hypothetical protein